MPLRLPSCRQDGMDSVPQSILKAFVTPANTGQAPHLEVVGGHRHELGRRSCMARCAGHVLHAVADQAQVIWQPAEEGCTTGVQAGNAATPPSRHRGAAVSRGMQGPWWPAQRGKRKPGWGGRGKRTPVSQTNPQAAHQSWGAA